MATENEKYGQAARSRTGEILRDANTETNHRDGRKRLKQHRKKYNEPIRDSKSQLDEIRTIWTTENTNGD